MALPAEGTRLYVGIDPSLSNTALVAIEQDTHLRVAATIRSRSRGVERLADLRRLTMQVIRDVQRVGTVVRVAIEGYSLGNRNQQGALALAEWGGVLRLALHDAGLPWIEIPPATAKKYAANRGDAPKDRMALAVYKRWGIELEDEHQTDAYVLARIVRDMDCAQPNELTVEQRAIIRRLLGVKEVAEHGA